MFSKEDTNSLKGISVLMVLFHHLFAFPERLPTFGYTHLFNFWTGFEHLFGYFFSLSIYVFMMLSGYGLYFSFKNGKFNILNRFKKLYLNYFIVFIVFIPLYYIFKLKNFNFIEIVENIFFIDFSYNYEWWYLKPYILFLFAFRIIYNFVEKNKLLYLVLTTLLINIGYFLIPNFSFLIFRTIEIFQLLPSFIIGMLLCKYGILNRMSDLDISIFKRILLSILILLIFLSYISISSNYFIIYSTLFLVFFYLIIKDLNLIKKVLIEIGKNSLNIWLIHSFYCYYLFKNFIYMFRYSMVIYIVLILLSYISSKLINIIYKNFSSIK